MSNRLRLSLLALNLLGTACIGACQREGGEGQPASSPQLPTPARSVEPPGVPDRFVFRPEFQTTNGPVQAGTAFAILLPNLSRPVLLTAIHLLGPAGGLAQAIPAAEVPRAVTQVSLEDCFDSSPLETFDARAILIPDAAPLGSASKAGDLVAFWLPMDAAVHPARLARTNPKAGTKVWLAASLVEGAPPSQRLHAATVRGIDEEGNIVYLFDNVRLSIRATSGAPVLDSKGEVVAVNLGGYEENGMKFGLGNPIDRFRPHLESAATASSAKP